MECLTLWLVHECALIFLRERAQPAHVENKACLAGMECSLFCLVNSPANVVAGRDVEIDFGIGRNSGSSENANRWCWRNTLFCSRFDAEGGKSVRTGITTP